MINKLLGIAKKNREIIAYVIVGGITTVANIVTYKVLFDYCHVANWTANLIAWVVGVIIAYVLSNKFVFLEDEQNRQSELSKIWKFTSARLVTLAIDEAGMIVMVDSLKLNSDFSKIFMNIIVIVLNYIFSKVFVFRSGKKK
ncbi:Putative flippase GtrA (transmembrane translocase of bactoprenol-linked glucose) [Anaeromicropila populeti]|uniref:Putative flippase GtrA (Transmembrane translocase of bactoprenol-linked glucose) n=2 Tax=Anaeromicropila populeti TaxID=37658 RepID=A0A1I6INU6_9FIRM|nr:Putative flippase GtrA (transmembrane translocase of bactoprenol-linked glucose) [Anaeromicropila populeti]